jgi:hypothetical protein
MLFERGSLNEQGPTNKRWFGVAALMVVIRVIREEVEQGCNSDEGPRRMEDEGGVEDEQVCRCARRSYDCDDCF